MPNKKYFVYDYLGDGFTFYDSEDEAKKALRELVRDYLIDGEDIDDIKVLFSGEVIARPDLINGEIKVVAIENHRAAGLM